MVHYEKMFLHHSIVAQLSHCRLFLSLASMILGFLFLCPFDVVRVKSYMHAFILPSVCINCNQSKKNFVSFLSLQDFLSVRLGLHR